MRPLFRQVAATRSKTFFGLRGCMKSGTNWACNLLNLHPQISCVGEYHWESLLNALHDNLEKRPMMQKRGAARRLVRRIERTIKETMLDLAIDDARVVGDRTPGAIEPFFVSDARYITMIRDGRDVLVSRAYHLLARPDRSALFADDTTMAELLARFQRDPQCFEAAPQELLASQSFVQASARMWVNILESNQRTSITYPELPSLTVRYEALHARTEDVRREMYRFLDVDPDLAAPLDDQTSPGFATVNPTSLYRRGSVGDWERYWNDRVEAWFMEIAGESMSAWGYR